MLSLSKTSSDGTPQPGAVFTYSIGFSCSSPVAGCINAAITDSIPAPLQIVTSGTNPVVTGSTDFTANFVGNDLTVSFHDSIATGGAGLNNGSAGVVQVQVVVPLNTPKSSGGTVVTNTANITADNAQSVSKSASVVLTVPDSVAAAGSKSFAPANALYSPGATTALTLNATNGSNISASSLVITDPTDPTAAGNPFDTLALSSANPFTSCALPSGASGVEIDAYVSGVWVNGTPAATPMLPAGVNAATVDGLRLIFVGSVDPQASGNCIVNLTQRTVAPSATNPPTVGGATVTNNAQVTVKTGAGSASSPMTAIYTIQPLNVVVTAAKDISPATIADGATANVAVSATNNSNTSLSTMSISEPASGVTFLDGNNLTFGAFVAQVWPSGATSAQLTYVTAGGPADSYPVGASDTTMHPPANAAAVTGFTIVYNGAIAAGAQAYLRFTAISSLTSGPAAGTASKQYPNTVTVAGTDLAGTVSSNASSTLNITPASLAVSGTKALSPNNFPMEAGRRTVAKLTADLTGSTVNATDVTLSDPADPAHPGDSAAFFDTMNVRGVVDSVPAQTTAVTQVFANNVWTTVDTSPTGPIATYTVDITAAVAAANLNIDQVVGVRTTYHSAAGFAPDGGTLSSNVVFVVRATSRATGNGLAGPQTLKNCAGTIATTGQLTTSNLSPVCDSLTLLTGGGGVASAKYLSPNVLYEHTNAPVNAELGWSAYGPGLGSVVVSDPSDGTATPVTGTFYQALNLIAIKPITASSDPFMKYDAVSKVELYNSDTLTWNAVSACTPASPCDGSFPGYTLTAAEQLSTIGERITYIENPNRVNDPADPNAPDVGSGVAVGGAPQAQDINGFRPVNLTFQLRDTVRVSQAGMSDEVSGDRFYNNSTTAGALSNTTTTQGYKTAVPSGVPTVTASANDTLTISDTQPLVLANKSWNPSSVSLASPGQAQPTSNLNLIGYNKGVQNVDSLAINDPTNGDTPFNAVAITGITGINMPAGGTNVQIVLTKKDGSSVPYSSAGAMALTPADLIDVVGINAVFSGRINPIAASDDPNNPASGTVGSVSLSTQVRAADLATGAAPTVGEVVKNTETVTMKDGSLAAPLTSRSSAGLSLISGTSSISAAKTYSPNQALQSAPGTQVEVNVTASPEGTVRKTNVVIDDSTPTFYNAFKVTGLHLTAIPGGADLVKVEYRTDTFTATGSAITVTPSNPATPWQAGSSAPVAITGPGMDLSAALPGVDLSTITGLRFTFSKADGSGIASSPAIVDITSATLANLRTGGLTPSTADPVAPGETAAGITTNTVNVSALDTVGTATRGAATATFTTNPGTVGVQVAKSAPGQVYPGTVVGFQLSFSNSGTGYVTNPVITDAVPVGLVYDPSSTKSYQSSLAAAGLSAPTSVVYDSTTRILTFSWPAGALMKPGELFTINLPLQVAPGMTQGTTVTNVAGITSDRTIASCAPYAARTTSPTSFAANTCSNSVSVTALKFGGFSSNKDVQAAVPAGGVNVVNPATACVSTADGFYRYPCTAWSTVGGSDTWRLSAVNGGNLDADHLVLIDTLPNVGDTGVVATGVSRNSTFRPVFTGNVNLDITDPKAAGTTMSPYYSTSQTPCTDDLNVSGPGCAPGDWLPYVVGVTDNATVRSVKFVFNFKGVSGGYLPPAATLKITYTTSNTPASATRTDGAPVDSAGISDAQAWSSFGIGGSYRDGSSSTTLAPAEPTKGGISLATGGVQVIKNVIQPRGYTFATTSFDATVACTTQGSGGVSVPLPNDGKVTLSTAGGTVTHIDATHDNVAGTPVRIDGIPVGSVCSVTENGTAGSYGEASRSTSAPVTVTQNASTAPIPASSDLTVSNTYLQGQLTVSKKVVNTASVGTFGPFHVTVTCTSNGASVTFTDGRLSFAIVDGQSVVVQGLPVGATCAVQEDKTGGANSQSIAVNGGVATSGAAVTGVVITDGSTASAATAAITNTFDAGQLAVTKTVTGSGSGQYGSGPFTAHVLCQYGTPTQTLYDADISIRGGQTVTLTPMFPSGTICVTTEPGTTGATGSAIDHPSVTIPVATAPATTAATTTVDITNTFDTGTLNLVKVRDGAGAAAFGAGPFTVQATCTYLSNGVTVTVALPGSGTVVLSSDNRYTSNMDGALIPVGARCSVIETQKGGADSSVLTPNNGDDTTVGTATIVAGRGDAVPATVTITNSFKLGSLQINKVRTGLGAALFGAGPFTMVVTCAPGVRTPVVLDAADSYTAIVSGLLVGSQCTVVETGAGGADSASYDPADPANAAQALVVIPGTVAPAVVTVTNTFLDPALTLVKSASPTTVSHVGEKVAYTFVVTNAGNVTIDNLYINDRFTAPAGPALSPITCLVTTLAADASTTCSATYRVTAADLGNGKINNSATANGTTPHGPVTSPPSVAVVITTPVFAVGDYVWRDENGNGIQDAGEPAVTGIVVILKNSAGAVVGSTKTDSKGYYHFDNLPAGSYSGVFTAPAGWQFTKQGVGSDRKIDSNVDSRGLTATFILGPPGAGNNVTASVSGDGVGAAFIDRTINAGIVRVIDPPPVKPTTSQSVPPTSKTSTSSVPPTSKTSTSSVPTTSSTTPVVTTTTTGPGGLAYTGFSLLSKLWWAVVLLALGGLALVLSRRPRRSAEHR